MAPHPLDSAIVFAPAGELVPLALRATAPGATVVIAGIHLGDIPALVYEDHLSHERDLRSMTANTRTDGIEFHAEERHPRADASISRSITSSAQVAASSS